MLADVAALVLPVVPGGVQHAEVGRRGGVEELHDLLVRVRVGVVAAVRVLVGELGVEAGEGVGGLVRDRVGALLLEQRDDARIGGEAHPAVGAQRLVGPVAAGEHHVDDGLEARVEEHVEGGLGQIAVLVGDLVGAVIGPEATSVMMGTLDGPPWGRKG